MCRPNLDKVLHCQPVGSQKEVLENGDKKKDKDFLSSIRKVQTMTKTEENMALDVFSDGSSGSVSPPPLGFKKKHEQFEMNLTEVKNVEEDQSRRKNGQKTRQRFQ